ncbi:MAG TPA: DUF883 family protein [Ramlibacter sp.]|nr:DUF883 family protein [Ramlibacter sp.]
MNDATQPSKDGQKRLAEDFKAVVKDAEELLRHAARDAGDGYNEARARLEQSIKAARAELEMLEKAVLENTRRAARATDNYVHEHPWESVGIGAAAGLLLGLLIARR